MKLAVKRTIQYPTKGKKRHEDVLVLIERETKLITGDLIICRVQPKHLVYQGKIARVAILPSNPKLS